MEDLPNIETPAYLFVQQKAVKILFKAYVDLLHNLVTIKSNFLAMEGRNIGRGQCHSRSKN